MTACSQTAVAEGVDTSMKPLQTTGFEAASDRSTAKAGFLELLPRDDAVLSRGESRELALALGDASTPLLPPTFRHFCIHGMHK